MAGNVNQDGQGYVTLDSPRPTYATATFAMAPPATATDFYTIKGSATKTVRITRIWISGRATAATYYPVQVLKYSSIYSGGSGTAQSIVAYDSLDPTATAVVTAWVSSCPTTLGTAVGPVQYDDLPMEKLALTATQPFTGTPGLAYDFSGRNAKAITLNGVGEYLAINGVSGAVPSGGVVDIKIEFTEA